MAAACLSLAACSGTSTGSSATAPPTTASAAPGQSAATTPAGSAEWSYSGDTGPEDWGNIAPACKTTKTSEQSPIDVRTATLTKKGAVPVVIHYSATDFELENNGHTIEAVPQDTKHDFITLGKTRYYLQQFHFHATSEHQINGKNTPMEMHLVHKSDSGATVVVGVLLKSGAANTPLAELFDSIPAEENSDDPVDLHHTIDLSKVIPADTELAQYEGSLTTPPCSEGVRWSLFLAPVTLSPAQIAAYTAVYPHNNRPIQPLSGRSVAESSATER